MLTILLALGWTWYAFQPSDDGTLAEIQARGTLRVGMDASFPPFERLDPTTNQIEGLDVDLAQAVADDLGIELDLVNIGFDGLYDALLARRVDLVLSGLPYDPRWTADVAYTQPYFNAGQVLLVRADDPRIQAIDDLSTYTVAVEWGSQADMEGRQLGADQPDLTFLRQPTAQEAVDRLLDGQADAAIVDGVTGIAQQARGLTIVRYLTDEWYVGAVHIHSQQLHAAVEASLSRLAENGQLEERIGYWATR